MEHIVSFSSLCFLSLIGHPGSFSQLSEEDIKYIKINFRTRVFLPVRVKPFFASLDNLHLHISRRGTTGSHSLLSHLDKKI